jgi:hypothetical protein
MPTYTFINTETNETYDKILSIAEREEYLKNNPHIKQKLIAPSIGDPVQLGVKRTPDGFQQLLNNARKKNKHSTIQSRY